MMDLLWLGCFTITLPTIFRCLVSQCEGHESVSVPIPRARSLRFSRCLIIIRDVTSTILKVYVCVHVGKRKPRVLTCRGASTKKFASAETPTLLARSGLVASLTDLHRCEQLGTNLHFDAVSKET